MSAKFYSLPHGAPPMLFKSHLLRLSITLFASATASWAQAPDPLRISSPTFITIPQATFFTTNINVTGGRPPYQFTVQSGTLPLGVFLNHVGTLSGISGIFGDSFAVIQATDADGRIATASFQIRIVQALAIITDTLGTCRVASPYQQTLRGVGGFLPLFGNYTWALSSGALPPGLNLTLSGDIVGTPLPPPGNYNVTIKMTDGSNNSVLKPFTLRIDGPIIITDRLPPGRVNQPYNQGIVAIGGIGLYSWSVKTGPIPPGISLTQAGVLTGTPFVPGTYTFEIRVSDSVGAYFDKTYTLPVDQFSSGIIFFTDTIADASVGLPFAQLLQASGGRDPYTFSISSGALPAGITLSLNGGLSGTPTVDGAFGFTVLAVDASGLQASKNFSINVRSNIFIVRTDLARAIIGVPYSQQLVVQGGTAPYLWTPFGNPVPEGLFLNPTTGTISGTPTTIGDYFFAVKVTDARNRTAQASYSLTISPAVPIFSNTGVLNGASFKAGSVSPGAIINIFGIGFGPGELAAIQIQNGIAATQLASTRVLFDEIAAPLLFSTLNQVGLVVPYEIAGRPSVNVVVEYKGLRSAPIRVNIAPSALGIFTADSSGKGQAAALNSDGRLNSPQNPAKPGSIVVLYATGEGQTDPFGISGKLATDVYPKPQLPVNVIINGQSAEVLYAGAAPNLIAGLLQVNVRIPDTITAVGSLPLLIIVGDIPSQEQVTISVAP